MVTELHFDSLCLVNSSHWMVCLNLP